MQQGHEQVDWARITYARVGVLRGLADNRSERQIADESGVAYSTIRSHVTASRISPAAGISANSPAGGGSPRPNGTAGAPSTLAWMLDKQYGP